MPNGFLGCGERHCPALRGPEVPGPKLCELVQGFMGLISAVARCGKTLECQSHPIWYYQLSTSFCHVRFAIFRCWWWNNTDQFTKRNIIQVPYWWIQKIKQCVSVFLCLLVLKCFYRENNILKSLRISYSQNLHWPRELSLVMEGVHLCCPVLRPPATCDC